MSKHHTDMNKTLFTPPELARILGVSRQEIVRRIKRGYIKTEIVGRQHIIKKREITRILKKEGNYGRL
jgi:excisionase family DNA binding protein